MDQIYQIEGVSLTVHMPTELDHPNAERIKKETDYYLENYHIQHIIFDFR
ncbi:MAG: anti-anti-sigma factor, partial [Lachnospiraceae bacterium]|nr:anti-anti-sigma factor [Lachnospiraceae bacterium]